LADVEIDRWICSKLGLEQTALNADNLFNIIQYFYPTAEFCQDEKIISESGCAYIKFSAKADKEEAILISEPTKEKTTQVLYSIVVAIAKAVEENKQEITFSKFT
jgi:hypothetical protein